MGAIYTQLSITERRKIERWRHAKVPVDEMARVLKRCRSTIFRELKRNFFSDESMPKCDGYYGDAAQMMQADRRPQGCRPHYKAARRHRNWNWCYLGPAMSTKSGTARHQSL